jgi:hypothetical protein
MHRCLFLRTRGACKHTCTEQRSLRHLLARGGGRCCEKVERIWGEGTPHRTDSTRAPWMRLFMQSCGPTASTQHKSRCESPAITMRERYKSALQAELGGAPAVCLQGASSGSPANGEVGKANSETFRRRSTCQPSTSVGVTRRRGAEAPRSPGHDNSPAWGLNR